MLSHFAKIPSLARLIEHLRIPLFWNGYALVFSSIATAGLGMVYWLLAAHMYPAEIIGINSALISAMILLANIAQLKLDNVLNRFIPRAGRSTRRLIIQAYILSTILALVASSIFVMGIDLWAPTLEFLKEHAFAAGWFCLSTVAWCIFVLQDSALVGLRQAKWIPVENILFALLKIGLLAGFAVGFTQYGVFASWTLPLMILLLPVNMLIFRRLVPQHVQATQNNTEPVVTGQVARYIAGDYFSSLLDMATFSLLPLIVVERVGAAANAYFYLALMITNPLQLVSLNMGMSLITEASADPSRLAAYSLRTFKQTVRLLIPIVLVIVAGAPYLLWLFGGDYRTEGTTVLRLLALSALPNLVTTIYLSTARVQRNMRAVFLVMLTLGLLMFGLSIILLDIYGINGIGIAFLLSETLVAGVLSGTVLRRLWFSGTHKELMS